MHEPKQVGILPAREHHARTRLWSALEEAYPVRFQAHETASRDALDAVALDAVIVFGADEAAPAIDIPSLTLHGEEAPSGTLCRLALATDPRLSRPLHGALLSDCHATAFPDTTTRSDTGGTDEVVLATLDGAPVWVAARSTGPLAPLPQHQRVACAPAELSVGEALRERLRPGRCLALLALAHFLARLTTDLRPTVPPLRAAFLIDDPNLHLPRYGHLDYATLLQHAREHGYHLAVAMVPLDARFAHPRAVRSFREGAAHLSLCMHGNDHDGPELGRPYTDGQAMAVVAQALHRTAAFQRRTGIAVDRVMVPPHERLSESVAQALYKCGFQALTSTRPYPWLADTLERSWLAHPPEAGPLVGWRPFDVVAGGLPVLLRADFERHSREDLVLRAFLGQPLILYGHHDLLAGGPDALARAAAEINRLGDVQWRSLETIAAACAPTRPALDPAALAAIPPPRRRLAPLLRRIASESRDRSQPLRARLLHTRPLHTRPLHTQPLHTQPLHTQPINGARDPAAAHAARPRSSSART